MARRPGFAKGPILHKKRVRDLAISDYAEPRKPHSSSPHSLHEKRNTEDVFASDENDSQTGSSDISESETFADSQLDAPRASQWVGEDELEGVENNDDDLRADESSDAHMDSLQDDLSSLPLGLLRKAQRTLANDESPGQSGRESEEGSDSEVNGDTDARRESQGGEKRTRLPRPRDPPAKRSSKHAPVEVTSKRPVSGKRTVVEVKTLKPRDPRFLSVAGQFSTQKFHSQYSFLKNLHSEELQTLKDSLKRARKLLQSSPRHLRSLHEKETSRLELAVKRAESAVNRDRNEEIELTAAAQAAKEEREKRKQGKAAWWMKQSERRTLITRARYDALHALGGTAAVKKAITKKQKKVGQAEKRSRPFRRDQSWMRGDGSSHKRKPTSDTQAESKKRRRMGSTS